MKHLSTLLLAFIIATSSFAQLNTKLIASKYGKGIVKVIIFDDELEKVKPGSGYLSRGSGFFVTRDGYIFTNRHVVEKCVKGYIDYDYKDATGKTKVGFSTYSEEILTNPNFLKAYNTGYPKAVIQVFHGNTESDYKLYAAKVVSISLQAFDGALLKVVSDENGNTGNFNFTALPIGDSNNAAQGEQLCVFGFPAQVRGGADVMLKDMSTLSLGIMSGFDYTINKEYGYLKTDAEIHPGNSGGPVFNEENKVIGIATATGVATGIGLVGGINGMYFVTSIDGDAHEKITKLGLKPPKRSWAINTITGAKQPMKTVSEINNAKGIKTTNSTSKPITTGDIYAKSKVFFSNVSVINNNNKIPSLSQRTRKFIIDRKKGGKIYIYLDNYPTPLATDNIFVLIDKLNKKGKYEKFKDLTYNIKRDLDITYFPYSFYEKGKFKFTIYSKEKKYINSGYVEIAYK